MTIHHLVLLRCRPEASDQAIAAVLAELSALVGEIPGLLSCHGGRNNSPEGKDGGYRHAFVMLFADAAARDDYLPHPAHRRVVASLRPLLADGDDAVRVVDFLS